ncbi:SCO family protein [Longirhabdus pacifica]|uniref:SCO family protein n=1 Tax=Longirhabdus pacifica TaxID=2305227 RepID=UPI001009211F|nr:SCO family protein [Longirhabdus pacifica]
MREVFTKKCGWMVIMTCMLVIAGCSSGEDYGFQKLKEAPSFAYTNMDGSTVTLDNTNGKARLVYHFFANCPDVCPPTTFQLSQIQDSIKEKAPEAFGEDILFLSITVDPENDTLETLQEYSKSYNPDLNGWYFMRAEQEYMVEMATAFGIGVGKTDTGGVYHQNIFAILDKEGNVVKYHLVKEKEIQDLDIEGIADELIYLAEQ